MANKQGNQPGDVKPGNELDHQRERQDGHPESAEQPGSAADVAKVKNREKP